MTQLAINFNPYPALYKPGTQLYRVYEALQYREEVSGLDFLKMGIPEYRSRINELAKDLAPHGIIVKRRRVEGIKFVFFSLGRE